MDRAVHGHQGLGRILAINVWCLSMSTGKAKMQTFQCFQYFTPLFWEQGDSSSSETLLSTDGFYGSRVKRTSFSICAITNQITPLC